MEYIEERTSRFVWNRSDAEHLWANPGGYYDAFVGRALFAGSADHAFFPEIDLTYLVQEWADTTLDNSDVLPANDLALSSGLKATERGSGTRSYSDCL